MLMCSQSIMVTKKKLRSYSLNLKINWKRPSIDSVFFPLRHLLIRQSSPTPLKLALKCCCQKEVRYNFRALPDIYEQGL